MRKFNQLYADKIKEMLDSIKFHYEVDDGVFLFSEGSKHKFESIYWQIFTKEHSADVYAIVPIDTEEECFDQTLEFISRASYGMPDGDFEFDFSDGEVRFHVHRELKHIQEDDLKSVMLDAFLTANLTYKRYSKDLIKVMLLPQPKSSIKSLVEKCETEDSRLKKLFDEICNDTEVDDDE